jgi:hypothetical protein
MNTCRDSLGEWSAHPESASAPPLGVAPVDQVERRVAVESWRKFSGANRGNKVSDHEENVGVGHLLRSVEVERAPQCQIW